MEAKVYGIRFISEMMMKKSFGMATFKCIEVQYRNGLLKLQLCRTRHGLASELERQKFGTKYM